MESRIIFEMTKKDFREAIEAELRRLSDESILNKFSTTWVTTRTAAEILDVHPDSIRKYAKTGALEHEMRGARQVFNLKYLLGVDFKKLKRFDWDDRFGDN